MSEFQRRGFKSPPFLFRCSASFNWGSHHTFSLTLAILSETTEWVRCERRSSRYSKCHSKLITSVSRLAVRPSCSDLEEMDGKVTTKHRVLWRRKRSNVVRGGYIHSCHRFNFYKEIWYPLFNFTLYISEKLAFDKWKKNIKMKRSAKVLVIIFVHDDTSVMPNWLGGVIYAVGHYSFVGNVTEFV